MSKYSLSVRIFHWVVGVLIIALVCVGLWMSGLQDSYPGRSSVYALHKSFGLLALFLITLRLCSRLASIAPDYRDIKIKNYEIKAAKVIHFLLYIVMFILPISGYCMSNFGGHPVAFFGAPVYAFEIEDKNLSGKLAGLSYTLHVYGAYTIIALVSLHVLGALKHYVLDKENIFKRIWF